MDRHAPDADFIRLTPAYRADFEALGLSAASVFTDPRIVAWRHLPDRENCLLDAAVGGGRRVRWHVKRYVAARLASPAAAEARGHELLASRGIPTADLVAWGGLANGRGFVIAADLAEHAPADKLIAAGQPFEKLLRPTAGLAAQLHAAGLHHRDLYLCHFMGKSSDDAAIAVRLIDVARVRALPRLTRRRWIVKDLAQFWYSTLSLPISDEQRRRWLEQYAQRAGGPSAEALRPAIERKVRAIARHDRRLRAAQPGRNISIPTTLTP